MEYVLQRGGAWRWSKTDFTVNFKHLQNHVNVVLPNEII